MAIQTIMRRYLFTLISNVMIYFNLVIAHIFSCRFGKCSQPMDKRLPSHLIVLMLVGTVIVCNVIMLRSMMARALYGTNNTAAPPSPDPSPAPTPSQSSSIQTVLSMIQLDSLQLFVVLSMSQQIWLLVSWPSFFMIYYHIYIQHFTLPIDIIHNISFYHHTFTYHNNNTNHNHNHTQWQY